MSDITFVNIPTQVELTHEWKTGIQRAVSGKEKRSALFSWPRVSVDYNYITITAAERNWFKNNLYQYIGQDHTWSVPIWSDACRLSADANSGQAVISCLDDPQYMNFQADRFAVLVDPSSYTNYEVIEISSVATNEALAKSTLSATWSSDSTYIVPLFDMQLDSQTALLSRTEDEVSRIKLKFKEAFLATLAHTYVVPAYTPSTYAGIDLFPAVAMQKKHDFEFRSNAIFTSFNGLGYAKDYFDETEMEMGFNFLLTNRASQMQLRNFFDRQLGRYGEFFIPTFDRDLRLTAGVGSSDTVLNIDSADNYSNVYFGNDLTGRYIMVFAPSGNSYARKITASSASTVTIAALGEAITADSRISLMHYVRFARDEFRMQLKGPWIARGQFKVKVLQGESAPS